MNYEELCAEGRTIYEILEEYMEMIGNDINIIEGEHTSHHILANPKVIYNNWLNDLEEIVMELKKRNS